MSQGSQELDGLMTKCPVQNSLDQYYRIKTDQMFSTKIHQKAAQWQQGEFHRAARASIQPSAAQRHNMLHLAAAHRYTTSEFPLLSHMHRTWTSRTWLCRTWLSRTWFSLFSALAQKASRRRCLAYKLKRAAKRLSKRWQMTYIQLMIMGSLSLRSLTVWLDLYIYNILNIW